MICLEDWLMIWQQLWNGARTVAPAPSDAILSVAKVEEIPVPVSIPYRRTGWRLVEADTRDVHFISQKVRHWYRREERASIVLWHRSISTLWLLAFSAFVAVSSFNLGFKTGVLTSPVVSLSDWFALICQQNTELIKNAFTQSTLTAVPGGMVAWLVTDLSEVLKFVGVGTQPWQMLCWVAG